MGSFAELSLFKGLRRSPRAFFFPSCPAASPNPALSRSLDRCPRWSYAEIGGDAVDLVHEPLARLVVIHLTDLGGPLVAVEGGGAEERVSHDLADPLRRDLLLAGDFVIGVALAQAGEYAASAEDPAALVKPRFPPSRRPYPPRTTAASGRPFSKAGMIARFFGNRKLFVGEATIWLIRVRSNEAFEIRLLHGGPQRLALLPLSFYILRA